MVWYPMNKGVANFYHYQEVALACNHRYLDALAVVDRSCPAYQELKLLDRPKVVDGRSYAGFNPARREDVRLFEAVLDGDHIGRRFSQRRHPTHPVWGGQSGPTAAVAERGGWASAQARARARPGSQSAPQQAAGVSPTRANTCWAPWCVFTMTACRWLHKTSFRVSQRCAHHAKKIQRKTLTAYLGHCADGPPANLQATLGASSSGDAGTVRGGGALAVPASRRTILYISGRMTR